MATVYIFDNREGTGHAALSLSDGTYVSFHPQNPSKLGPVYQSYEGAFSKSLGDDIEPSRGGPPKYIMTEKLALSGLHEEAMSSAFDHMKGRTDYRLYSMNCSTVVAKLLIIGAGEAIINSHWDVLAWRLKDHARHFFSSRNERFHGRLTERAIGIAESAVTGALRAMEAESRNGGRPRRGPILPVVTGLTVVADVVARDFVWNPGEVLRFAEYIKEHLREPQERSW